MLGSPNFSWRYINAFSNQPTRRETHDGTAGITATICTPDAEKLMPFTATELREAEEINLDLHADIAMSVKQHTIVAFIRSYETTYYGQAELKIHVVKAYKLGEVPSQPNLLDSPPKEQAYTSGVTSPVTAILPPKEHVSRPVDDVSYEEQLFSPSTKVVLEEIHSSIFSKSVKRSLPFTREQIDKVTVSASTKTQPSKALASTNKPAAQLPTGTAIALVAVKKEIGSRITDGSPTKKLKEL